MNCVKWPVNIRVLNNAQPTKGVAGIPPTYVAGLAAQAAFLSAAFYMFSKSLRCVGDGAVGLMFLILAAASMAAALQDFASIYYHYVDASSPASTYMLYWFVALTFIVAEASTPIIALGTVLHLYGGRLGEGGVRELVERSVGYYAGVIPLLAASAVLYPAYFAVSPTLAVKLAEFAASMYYGGYPAIAGTLIAGLVEFLRKL